AARCVCGVAALRCDLDCRCMRVNLGMLVRTRLGGTRAARRRALVVRVMRFREDRIEADVLRSMAPGGRLLVRRAWRDRRNRNGAHRLRSIIADMSAAAWSAGRCARIAAALRSDMPLSI